MKALVTLAPLPRSGAGGHEVKAEVNVRPPARITGKSALFEAPYGKSTKIMSPQEFDQKNVKPMNDLTRDMTKQLVKTKRPKASPIWTTSRGREVPVADMSNDHLKRAYAIVERMPREATWAGRKAEEWRTIFTNEMLKR